MIDIGQEELWSSESPWQPVYCQGRRVGARHGPPCFLMFRFQNFTNSLQCEQAPEQIGPCKSGISNCEVTVAACVWLVFESVKKQNQSVG